MVRINRRIEKVGRRIARVRVWCRVAAIGFNLLPAWLLAQGARQEFREVHLGMEVRVALYGIPGDAGAGARAARAAFDTIAALESVFSDWRPSSEIRLLSDHPSGTWVPVSEPLAEVLALALDVARATEGAFDPTVGPLTALWRESRRTGHPVPDSARLDAVKRVGHDLVELDRGVRRVRLLRDSMRIDLGAIAKGWIIERALDVLRRQGASAALIEAGGDIALFGAPPGTRGWSVVVSRQSGDTVLVLTSGAVSTSGPAEQWLPRPDGSRESHVLVPSTGVGLHDNRSITVSGPSAAITDALATALSLVPDGATHALAARFGVRVVSDTRASTQWPL